MRISLAKETVISLNKESERAGAMRTAAVALALGLAATLASAASASSLIDRNATDVKLVVTGSAPKDLEANNEQRRVFSDKACRPN